jgi:hypothetical protein
MGITVFSELISRFNTAESLITWLRSDEGGSLTVREDWMTVDRPHVLIHYDKKKSNLSLPHVGYFRSVVWDMVRNRPMCMGPPHGLDTDGLADDVLIDGGVAEEFADGIMVNLYHDGQSWRVSTHTQVESNRGFYGHKPFATLFWDVFNDNEMSMDTLAKDLTYSFVLQHPDERIVDMPKYNIPLIWLVGRYRITEEGEVEVVAMDGIPMPKVRKHSLVTVGDVRARVEAWGRRFQHNWQGLVFYHEGRRYKLRSTEYIAAKELRGNQSNRPFLWLERWGEGKLPAYLRVFPEETASAESVVGRFKELTQELYDLYQRVYRKRDLPLGQAPRKFRKLLWDAHKEGKGAYFKSLREFMNAQDTARKLWLVNYEKRYPEVVAPTTEAEAPTATEVEVPTVETINEEAPTTE